MPVVVVGVFELSLLFLTFPASATSAAAERVGILEFVVLLPQYAVLLLQRRDLLLRRHQPLLHIHHLFPDRGTVARWGSGADTATAFCPGICVGNGCRLEVASATAFASASASGSSLRTSGEAYPAPLEFTETDTAPVRFKAVLALDRIKVPRFFPIRPQNGQSCGWKRAEQS